MALLSSLDVMHSISLIGADPMGAMRVPPQLKIRTVTTQANCLPPKSFNYQSIFNAAVMTGATLYLKVHRKLFGGHPYLQLAPIISPELITVCICVSQWIVLNTHPRYFLFLFHLFVNLLFDCIL